MVRDVYGVEAEVVPHPVGGPLCLPLGGGGAVFGRGKHEPEARTALADAEQLFARLVEADRLIPETAERLLASLRECGGYALAISE